MAYHKFVQSFNAGEISPFLANRTDVAKYESACQRLENMILLPYGGAMRRPGTQYIGKAKLPNHPCRLIGFNFSVTTNFILEFGWGYVRFWTNGQQVHVSTANTTLVNNWSTSHGQWSVGQYALAGSDLYFVAIAFNNTNSLEANIAAGNLVLQSILETQSPYLSNELNEIQYCQINDIMYLVHPNHPVWKLTRNADDYWTMIELGFKWPPTQDENIKNITVTPSATSGTISLTASGNIFTPEDVGSTWQVGHNMAGLSQTYVEVALGITTAVSPTIRVRGAWSFTTYGSWKGEVRIWRMIYRTSVVEYIRVYVNSVEGQRNVATTGTEDEDCELHIEFFTAGSAGTSTPMARLEFSNAKVYGLVAITAYNSPSSVTGVVTWGLAQSTATTFWSEPAFNRKWGFPRTVCLHDQRLCFGGTKKKPLSIHGSQIDDFENFQRGALPDHAFLFTLSANESNPINWMVSQQKLLIGTAGNEWSMGAAKEEEALGPANVKAQPQSSFGSAYIQARLVNEVVLFTQRQGKKVRELTYSFQKDGWVAPDLTILAAHIAGEGGGFLMSTFCQQPDAIFWAVTGDGHLVGMTYERDQNVVGWHHHSTQGFFESVASIYGGSKADEVWFSVKREWDRYYGPWWLPATAYVYDNYVGIEKLIGAILTRVTYRCTVNHTSSAKFETDLAAGKWVPQEIPKDEVRFVERFDPNFRPTLEAEDKDHYWYLDCAYRYGGSETNVITNLGHLEGKTVGVLGDGANQPTRVVVNGQVTLQEPAELVLVGLPYDSLVKPMNLNIPTQDTMQGRKVRIHKVVARIYKSLTCKFSSDDVKFDEIFFRERASLMDDSPPVFTGDKEVYTGAAFSPTQAITLKQDRPFPLCVLAMVYWTDAYGS